MKTKVKFVLRSKDKTKSELCTLTMRIGHNRKYAYQDTGIQILQSQFDEPEAERGFWRVIINHEKALDYNMLLKALMDKAYEIDTQLKIAGKLITARIIKDKLKHADQPASKLFADVLGKDRSIESNTKVSISSMMVRLEQFYPGVNIEQIDYNFAKSFETWLLTQPSRLGTPLSVNTANKYLRDLKVMLERCIKYEYVERNKLTGYDHIKEPRGTYVKREAFDFEDLQKLENETFEETLKGSTISKIKSVLYTRDMVLFSCYTGLRLADLLLVSRKHVDADGILTIETQKGNKNVRDKVVILPLKDLFDGKGYDLFKKYSKNKIGAKPIFGDKAKVTHQHNMGLIVRLLFPGRKLSIHSARHTFETQLREMGFDPFTIQRLMNHKDVRTTTNVYDHSSWNKEHSEIKEKFKKAE